MFAGQFQEIQSLVTKHVNQGDAKGAASLLVRFLVIRAMEKGIEFNGDQRIDLSVIFSPDRMESGIMDLEWHWLWNLLREQKEVASLVLGDLEEIVLKGDLPIHLKLEPYLLTGLVREVETYRQLVQEISECESWSLAHALFQRLVSATGDISISLGAEAWKSIHDGYRQLLLRFSQLPEARSVVERARHHGPRAGMPKKVVLVTAGLASAKMHGPTTVVVNYANLLQSVGMEVTVVCAEDGICTEDVSDMMSHRLKRMTFEADGRQFNCRVWQPAKLLSREQASIEAIEQILLEKPDMILLLGASRSIIANDRFWRVPVISLSLHPLLPTEISTRQIMLPEGCDDLIEHYDGIETLGQNFYFHKRLLNGSRIHSHRNPRPVLQAHLGIRDFDRTIVSVGYDLATHCTEEFCEMVRRVLESSPGTGWLFICPKMSPYIQKLMDDGLKVAYRPIAMKLNAVYSQCAVYAHPWTATGSGGAQLRALRSGLPVLSLKNPKSDGHNLFLRKSSVENHEAYEEQLIEIISDTGAANSLWQRQFDDLSSRYPDFSLKGSSSLKPFGHVFLEELQPALENYRIRNDLIGQA